MKIDIPKARGYLTCAADESLSDHDKRYHGGHFDPKKGTCGKRARMSSGDYFDSFCGEDPDARTTRLAPNGRRSNLTNRQYAQVRTKEFKAWFGDWENNPERASKVVDENGEPLVLFHGTRDASFHAFSHARVGAWNFGFHFGTRHAAETRVEKDGHFKQCFLNVRNPFRCSDGFGIPKALVFDELADVARKAGKDDIEMDLVKCGDRAEGLWENGFEDEDRVSRECTKVFLDALAKLGFDGIVYENEYEEDERSGEDSWMTVLPVQAKSATDNQGKFSPDDADMRR